MNRLGYDPEQFTYSLYPTNACKCGNYCRFIRVFSNDPSQERPHTTIAVYRAIPIFGPFERRMVVGLKDECTWCEGRVVYRYKWTVCPAFDGGESSLVNRCDNCQSIINRMYEYWENRHPLLKDLSPNDYLKTEIREPIIAAKCEELCKKLYIEIFALSELIPKDIRREIINNRFKIIHTEFQLSAEDLCKDLSR